MLERSSRFHEATLGRQGPAHPRQEAEVAQRGKLVETMVPAGRAHVVGLSWGGGLAHELLGRRPDVVDRAVIDGAGVLTSRPGPAWLAGVSAVSPFPHSPPVIALFSQMIGMDQAGRADLRGSSPRAFRRAFIEGFRSGVSRVERTAESPTLLVAGEQETAVRPCNAALAELMPNAQARYVPGLGHGWLARRPELHVAMVEAWLTGAELPPELVPEVPAPATVNRLRRALGENPTDRSNRQGRSSRQPSGPSETPSGLGPRSDDGPVMNLSHEKVRVRINGLDQGMLLTRWIPRSRCSCSCTAGPCWDGLQPRARPKVEPPVPDGSRGSTWIGDARVLADQAVSHRAGTPLHRRLVGAARSGLRAMPARTDSIQAPGYRYCSD